MIQKLNTADDLRQLLAIGEDLAKELGRTHDAAVLAALRNGWPAVKLLPDKKPQIQKGDLVAINGEGELVRASDPMASQILGVADTVEETFHLDAYRRDVGVMQQGNVEYDEDADDGRPDETL